MSLKNHIRVLHSRFQATPRSLALGVAGSGFIGGFGAMNAFWFLGRQDTRLPGLYDYLTSSIGDAVIIPSMLGTLTYANACLPNTRLASAALRFGFAFGSLAGAATQVSWLVDDQPGLNWTLPAPHKFNAAGIYHGLFLTITSGVTGGLFFNLAARWIAMLRSSSKVEKSASIASAIAVTCAIAFSILLWQDNKGTLDRSASKVSLIAATAGGAMLALLVLAILISLPRRDKDKPHVG